MITVTITLKFPLVTSKKMFMNTFLHKKSARFAALRLCTLYRYFCIFRDLHQVFEEVFTKVFPS